MCQFDDSSFSHSRDITGAQNLKWVTGVLEADHAPFKGVLLSLSWDFTQPICVQNLTTLAPAVPEMWLVPNFYTVLVTWSRPFQEWLSSEGWYLLRSTCLPNCLYHHPLWRYERWQKIWKLEWFGVVRVTQRYWQLHHSIERIWVPISHFNYVPILHRFWDIARYWSKITDFNLLYLSLAPLLGWPRWIL